MIIQFKQPLQTNIVKSLTQKFATMGMHGFLIDNHLTVIGMDHYDFSQDELNAIEVVIPEQPSFVLASRDFHPEDTVIKLPHCEVGGQNFTIVAGPSAIEDETMIQTLARIAKQGGATILMGRSFFNYEEPYSFKGMGETGLKALRAAADENDLDVMSEVADATQIELVSQYSDILEVSAANMHNTKLLQALGHQEKPVAVRQSLDATIEDWLNATEFIASEGNQNIILLASGTVSLDRDFSQSNLDVATMPIVHSLSHYPLLIDPNEISGDSDLVLPISRAAVAAGVQGLALTFHEFPNNAKYKRGLAVSPNEFMEISRQVTKLNQVVGAWQQ